MAGRGSGEDDEDAIFSSRARELRDEGDAALQRNELRNALTAFERVCHACSVQVHMKVL